MPSLDWSTISFVTPVALGLFVAGSTLIHSYRPLSDLVRRSLAHMSGATEAAVDAAALAAARSAAAAAYEKQAAVVAKLRASGAACDAAELEAALALLKEKRQALDAAKKEYDAAVGSQSESSFNRAGCEMLLKRRFFYTPAFEIYGGVGGLYDYGPPGCTVKNNLISLWRQHFIVQENMLELEATCLTPEVVLKASGHVDKFTDLMVRDAEVSTACFRADHLLEDHIDAMLEKKDGGMDGKTKIEPLAPELVEEITALRERIDEIGQEEMDAYFEKYNVVAPETGNKLTKCYPFNLMFPTQIGPTGLLQGYLRPETAQGIFVNFKRLYDYAAGKLPFACAQIGLSFRNEISPQSGLLRVREFQQAEIEHFVDPRKKDHPKFASVADMVVSLYGRQQQLTTFEPAKMTVGEAVSKGVIANQTLGYFIARTNAFVKSIGLNMDHVRFRQHLEHEMAHYAADCWDLEVRCSYKWVECAGLADRSAYDLSVHSDASKIELSAFERLAEPKEVSSLVAVPNKGLLGRAFKKDAQLVMKRLAEMSEDDVKALQVALESGPAPVTVESGASFDLTKEQVSFKVEKKKISGENFYPSVIEPSFGIGRLLYCLWEHVYYVREGDREENAIPPAVLRLPAAIAPVKCVVLPLSKNDKFVDLLARLSSSLSAAGLINRIDDSGQSIGRRYARADEIGTPFGITVDFDSLTDSSVTVRERDSTLQVRCSVEEAVSAISDVVAGRKLWSDVQAMHPAFTSS